jgi:hypothetical protein
MTISAIGMLTAVHSAVQEPVSLNSTNPKGNIQGARVFDARFLK